VTGLDTTQAVGFGVSGASLDLAIVSEATPGTRSWTGVAAHVGLMSVYGLPTSFALNVRELDLLYNIAATDTTKLDWDSVSQVDSLAVHGIDHTLDLQVSGSLDLDISGFVLAAAVLR